MLLINEMASAAKLICFVVAIAIRCSFVRSLLALYQGHQA
jgi:hypothetical protein